jgi:tagatose kinase
MAFLAYLSQSRQRARRTSFPPFVDAEQGLAAMTDTKRGKVAPEASGLTLTVGEILVEIMATTTGMGFLEPQALKGPFPSGAPAIFIDQVARLGGSAGIIACVGRDDFGKMNMQRLETDGADISGIAVSDRFPTGTAFVRYRPDGSRDFVYNIAESAAGKLGMTEAAERLIARTGHFHVMGTALSIGGAREIIARASTSLRARGGSFSFDPNARKELIGDSDVAARFTELVNSADILLPSGDELFIAAGVDDEAAAVSALIARGVGEIVLKRGAAGSSRYGADGVRVDCAGFAVEEVDPTGAGDCFGAAYVTCRRRGMDPETSLYYANAAGAHAVTKLGPMEGAGSLRELEKFARGTARRT